MTLHIYTDLEQGTDEWLAARCGILTASTIGQLITAKTVRPADNDYSRGLTMTLIAQRITGYVEEVPINKDMERGNLAEPYARDLYAEHYAPVEEVGFMVREEPWGRLGYSPDGLVGDDGLIEIKSPRQKAHLTTILADSVPPHYMAQCQTGLYVSGREWVDFISYHGGMPLYVKRVTPDERWQSTIEEVWRAFEQRAAETIRQYEKSTKNRPATERVDLFGEDIFL